MIMLIMLELGDHIAAVRVGVIMLIMLELG